MKALRCPFLTRVSVNQITQNARSLLSNHVGSCPVMTRMMSTLEISADQGRKTLPKACTWYLLKHDFYVNIDQFLSFVLYEHSYKSDLYSV